MTKKTGDASKLLYFSIGYSIFATLAFVVALVWVVRTPAASEIPEQVPPQAPLIDPTPASIPTLEKEPDPTFNPIPVASCIPPLSISPTFVVDREIELTPVKYTSITIPAPSLANNIVNEPIEQSVEIYLPPSYENSDYRYPVVYFLPGFGSDPSGNNKFLSVEELTEAMSHEEVLEMIIVIPNGANVLHGSFYVNSSVTGNWEDFILKDVIGFIDSHYRTIPQATSRAIAGHSMGGYAALSMAMRYPNLFCSVYSLSGGFFAENGLETTFMFDEPRKMRNYLNKLSRYATLPFDIALNEMEAIRGGAIEFATAYGAAFAPNPEGGSVFLKYPYFYENGVLTRNPEIWTMWENGFGNWPQKINEFKPNLAQLAGIRFDFGTNDERPWIPPGNEYVAAQLQLAGIQVEVNPFEGRHGDKLSERMLDYMLPYLSGILASGD